ncbi:MAG: BatA domain-containing protein [Bacteroidales bacterium]|nr:BatA domain-containing protein [Bacteroidales bacterium]
MIFANPLMLIGLIAVAIPIAVHLFNFRRYRKVMFSNVDHLTAMHNETRRRSNLRQLLILAARILAIVFLVLAFARPTLPTRGANLQNGSTAVSIFVDNSFSMENAGTEGSLLTEARRKVGEIAAAYGPETQFQLMTGDMSGHQFRWLDRDELLNAVADLDESPNTLSLSLAAKRQAEFLNSSPAPNRHLYIVGDFQQSTADLEQLPHDSTIEATLVPLAAEATANLFIDTLRLNAPSFVRGATVEAEATIRNTGNHDAEKTAVRLYVAGRERAIATTDVAAGSHATVALRFVIDADGPQDCFVELTDYPVTFDDRLYFSLNVTGRTEMTIVNGGQTNSYLTRLYAYDSAIACTQTTVANIDYSQLGSSTFVVLNGLTAVSSGLAQTLHTFVNNGGSLLVIPPAEADILSYNNFLAQFSSPLLRAFERRKLKATTIDLGSKLYRNVFSGRNDEMELPTTNAHFALETTAQTVRQQVISLADGSDLLSLTPCGEGTLYLLTTPLEPTYCDFAEQALFVPTLLNMALYSRNLRQPYYIAGQTDPIALGSDYPDGYVPHLTSDDGQTDIVPDLRRMGNHTAMLTHGRPERAGNYHLSQPSGSSEAISFNYDRRESRLTFVPKNEIATRLTNAGLDNYTVADNPERPLTDQIAQRTGGRQLWMLFVILTLAMIGTEIALIKL